jgi:hypothetical protein
MIASSKSQFFAILRALCLGALAGTVAAGLPSITTVHDNSRLIVVGIFVIAPVTLVLGVPTYYLLKLVRALNWPGVAIAGALFGALAAGLLTTNSSPPYFTWLYFGTIGVATACTSLFAFRRSNPSLNADVPHAGRRPGSGPPIS